MKTSGSTAIPIMLVALAGCTAMAGTWPDRTNRSPGQMLEDVVRWQQYDGSAWVVRRVGTRMLH